MQYVSKLVTTVLVLVMGTAAASAQAGFMGVGWDGPGQGAASLGFNVGEHPGLEDDQAENWTSHRIGPGTCTFSRCDLYYVALHEIGHALGLTHPSDVRNTPPGRVMNPFFNPVFGSAPGFGAFDSIQPPDIADLCGAYSCTGAGFVRPLGAAVPVPEPPTGTLLLAGLLVIAMRLSRPPMVRS